MEKQTIGGTGKNAVAAASIRENYFVVEAFDRHGRPLWKEQFANLVVDEGLNDSLDRYFTGSSYTAAWYVGLTAGSPTFAAEDTMNSHSGWTEVTDYSETTRQQANFGAASGGSIDNSANRAEFNINADGTVIGGCFLTTSDVKGGTVGTLYGGGAFSGGNRTLGSGDLLRVTVTCTASAA